MASIWQITLSGYDAQAASESGQSATGKIALGTWGSYGHETIQVTLAEPWDVCTLVTATFWPTYPPDHWDTPGIRVALGTDGLLTVPPEATNRPTQTGRVVFEGLADNEKIISADVRYTVRDHAPTGGTESTATPSLLEQLLTQTGSNAQVAAQSADAAAKSASAAAENADAASASKTAAATSEGNASASADAAAKSAEMAADSQQAAKASEAAAQKSQQASEAAEGEADAAKDNAQSSAEAAAKSASAAAGSESAAAESAAASAASQAAAAASESNAAVSETNAKTNADASAKSAEAAAASASAAADSEKSAKSSADAASASKAEAANSASAAATSKTAAATSESNAKTSADAAAKSASAAASSANSAAGSATTAADSKTAAATSEANAKASADEAAASMKAAAASALEAAGYDGEKITLDVAVKNTGDTAGKYVAEIFYEPPYYNGGIEKAAANLVQYAKTEILQPGEAQTLKITFRYEDMASYDSNGIKSANGAYVLEAGDYKINLCSDSHTILDTYVAKVDKDVIYDDAHDGARSTDQVAATNQLTFAQGDVTYLSRADGFANYAEATAAPANHSLSAQALADYASAATFDAAKYDDPNAVMPTTGANNGLKLADLTGVAYDDPKWEQLLDELTVNDLFSLTADGGYHTVGVESIGLSATEDCDGPTGVHSNYNPAAGPSYPGSVMLACTWNQPLAKARGEQIAKECAEINCAGWYAPAMNIHRSAFGGRNFEYYSECGVLSGLTAAAEVSGATENGLICYVKHFAFNDQDNYRQNNICTWLNEQSAREIYLKAFEQPIKAGGMGVMTSMNAVGPVWAGGCKALLTNILRDEWGFHGAVITDAVVSPWYMDGNLAIRTGGTKMLAFNITNEFYRDLNSVGTVTAMRNAAHGTLYALANSFAVTRAVAVPKWVKTTYAVDAVVAIILVAWEICAIRKYRKAKKEDEDTEQ